MLGFQSPRLLTDAFPSPGYGQWDLQSAAGTSAVSKAFLKSFSAKDNTKASCVLRQQPPSQSHNKLTHLAQLWVPRHIISNSCGKLLFFKGESKSKFISIMSLPLAVDMLCEWKKTTTSFKGRSSRCLTCKNPLSPTRALRGRCCHYLSHLTDGGAITPKPSEKGTGEWVPVPTWPLNRHAFQALGTVPGPGREVVNEVIFAFKVRVSWGKQQPTLVSRSAEVLGTPPAPLPSSSAHPRVSGEKLRGKIKGMILVYSTVPYFHFIQRLWNQFRGSWPALLKSEIENWRDHGY